MAGETVGIGNANYNPYLMQQYAAANDDFMANLHFNEIEKSGKIPGLTETAGSPAFKGNTESDRFEKSGGPGLMGTAATAGIGAAGGSLGAYYLMSNPIENIQEKTLKTDFYKTIDKADLAAKTKTAIESAKNTKGYNLAQLAKLGSFDALPEDVKNYLKNNGLDKVTAEQAKEIIKKTGHKVEDFELENIVKKTTENFKGTQYYNNIIKASTDGQIISAINNAKDTDELKALITKNKEFFGLKGTEAEIAQQAEALAAKGKTEVAEKANNIINKAEDYILKRKEEIFKNLNKEGKLLDNADEATKALFKDFKWQQAKKYGKWGAIIGAGLAVIYGMFGGSPKTKA